jgi:hypothetical protein
MTLGKLAVQTAEDALAKLSALRFQDAHPARPCAVFRIVATKDASNAASLCASHLNDRKHVGKELPVSLRHYLAMFL